MAASGQGDALTGLLIAWRRRRLSPLVKQQVGDATPAVIDDLLFDADAGGASHPTSGAMTSDAATVSGTATHATLHASTGALSAQASAISGAAAHHHATTGSLSAQAAGIAGTAAHAVLHSSTGALSAGAAALSGQAVHHHAAAGALASDHSSIAGTAAHTALAPSHDSTGALEAAAAQLSGAAAHEHATAGALVADPATLDGTAAHSTVGAHDASGALQAGDATVAGIAEMVRGAPGPGFFSEASTMPSAAPRRQRKVARPKTVERVEAVVHEASGALQAAAASMAGAATRFHVRGGLYRQTLSERERLLRLAIGVDDLLAHEPDNAELAALAQQIDDARLDLIESELAQLEGSAA